MIGEGPSTGCSQHRKKSGKNTMKGCKVRGNLNQVVLIDVESDEFDNVIIIDVPETLHHKFRGPSVIRKGERFSFPGIICIDDDGDECESDEFKPPEMNVESRSDLDSDGSSSSSSEHVQKSVDTDAVDPRIIQDNIKGFRLSKCKEGSSSNRYGLSTEPDVEASGSDSSDCEIIEGPSVELNEQWERVRLKRKSNCNNFQCGEADCAAPSSFNRVNPPDFDVHSRTKENAESFCTSSKNVDCEKVAPSAKKATEDGFIGEGDTFTNSNEKVSQASETNNIPERPFFEFSSKNNMSRDSTSNSNLRPGSYSDCGISVQEDNSPLFKGQSVDVSCNFDIRGVVLEQKVEQLAPDMSSNNTSPDDTCCIATEKQEPVSLQLGNMPGTSGAGKQGESYTDSMANVQLRCESNTFCNSLVDVPTVQRDIINEREELKKTDEYKRVMEEEWAARQLQLKIQAEEAQRQRRKRKAEMLRILDMEKRQKQRLEEMRASQKKDEENLSMKEIIRAEVRKELYLLEMKCVDMASLLRCLGIHVGGGFQSTSHEVRAAYKQALLKFHPDRSSRTDMRQQVEAEEKFKLISRMKEKLSISSY